MIELVSTLCFQFPISNFQLYLTAPLLSKEGGTALRWGGSASRLIQIVPENLLPSPMLADRPPMLAQQSMLAPGHPCPTPQPQALSPTYPPDNTLPASPTKWGPDQKDPHHPTARLAPVPPSSLEEGSFLSKGGS